jgi:hypothetical protein
MNDMTETNALPEAAAAYPDLPWAQMDITEGIPWDALKAMAMKLAESPEFLSHLEAIYDEGLVVALGRECYVDLHVLAVIELAEPHLSPSGRSEAIAFLVRKLVEAGDQGLEFPLEDLMVSCARFGPDCLPEVLDALANEPDVNGAWFFLWGLPELVVDSPDAALRERVAAACMTLLQETLDGQWDLRDIPFAAYALGKMRYEPARPLITRLIEEGCHEFFGAGDLEEALRYMDGSSETDDYQPWDEPTEKYMQTRWKSQHLWFHSTKGFEPELADTYSVNDRIRLLVGRFARSEHAAAFRSGPERNARRIASCVLLEAFAEFGARPSQLDAEILRTVLIETALEETSLSKDDIHEVTPVTIALLEWLDAEAILPHGAELAATIADWKGEIEDAITKRFNEEARIRNQEAQRFRLVESAAMPASEPRDAAPQVGRNAPCPCGSGKKFKKCCGG